MLRQSRQVWANASLSSKGLVVVGVPLLIFVLAGLFSNYALRQAQQNERLVHEAYEVQLELQRIHTLILEAGSGVRGYLLTGEADLLTRYFEAKDQLPPLFDRTLRRLGEDDQLESLRRVRTQVDQELAALGTLLDYTPLLGEQASGVLDNVIVTSQVVVSALSRQLDTLQQEQQRVVALRELEQARTTRRYYSALVLSWLVGIAGGLVGVRLFALGITRRIRQLAENAEHIARGQSLPHEASSRDEIGRLSASLKQAGKLLGARETELQQVNTAMRLKFDQLTQQHHQIILLNQLAAGLQTAQSVDASLEVLHAKVAALCPGTRGALYLIDEAEGCYKAALQWEGAKTPASFALHQCLAPAKDQHYVYGERFVSHCAHVAEPYPEMSLCYALVVGNKPLGVLHVQGDHALSDDTRAILGGMADRFSLAVDNLSLQDSLLQQAIRDPLTGLYNRRYLEDVLDRELRRAKRSAQPLSLLIGDIDHFKSINDAYGHRGGDEVLRAFGQLLGTTFRAQDIPCRYGGEEFVVVLPETGLTHAQQRAEELAQQVRSLKLPVGRRTLDSLSISLGVAVYPEHGRTAQLLLSSADSAMYAAKHQGRDRVVTALTPETAQSQTSPL